MPSSPVILAFDTSTAHCVAALLCEGSIVAHHVEIMAKGQVETYSRFWETYWQNKI